MPLAHPGTLFRRGLFDSLGGFDESYRSAGDLDFFVRALLRGATFRFVNRHIADFRLHAGQVSKGESLADSEKARALQPLASVRTGPGALWRFRMANLGVYASRLFRHGPVGMKELYRKVT
jgi:GT2 family glycosyltransferase